MELIFIGVPLSFLAAVIPTGFWVFLIGWMDRYEKEPWLLRGVAFIWGSVGSLLLSIIVEVVLGIPIRLLGGNLAGILGSSLVAPVTEEVMKGLMILLFFVFAHREFDDLMDGIIYGAIIGAGFAMSENFLYLLTKFSHGGPAAFGSLVVMRTGVFGLSHSLYTGITGAGFGLIRYRKRWLARIGLPVEVVGALARNHLDAAGRQRGDPDGRSLAAAVVLPRRECPRDRHVGQLRAVRRISGFEAHRQIDLLRGPAVQAHGEQLAEARIAGARRAEQDALAVRRPAQRDIGRGMPGQPLRHSAFGRDDEDVGVTVVFAGEGDLGIIRRKSRIRFDAGARG